MKIAVCICTCERPALLENLLASLRKVDLTNLPDVEIVVVDNAPDSARAVCGGASGLAVPLLYRPEPRRGRGIARNSAVDEALRRGADFLAFIDDDDIPEPDWLRHLAERQRETNADIVYGAWRQGSAGDAPRWAKRTLGFFEERSFDELRDNGVPRNVGTGNVMISCEFLRCLSKPAFDPVLRVAEDTDFRIRATQAGASMAFTEKSMIVRGHGDRQSTLDTLKRGFEQGGGRAVMTLKYRSRPEVYRKFFGAALKFAVRLLLVPIYIVSPDKFMRNIYSLARGSGLLRVYGMSCLGFRTVSRIESPPSTSASV